jgi:hypothetical protein
MHLLTESLRSIPSPDFRVPQRKQMKSAASTMTLVRNIAPHNKEGTCLPGPSIARDLSGVLLIRTLERIVGHAASSSEVAS